MTKPSPSPAVVAVHPQLHAVLGTLDLTLESELALFRQGRISPTCPEAALPSPAGDFAPGSPPATPTAKIEEDASSLSPGQARDLPAHSQSEDITLLNLTEFEDDLGEIDLAPASETTALVTTESSLTTYTNPSLEDYLESSEDLLRHFSPQEIEDHSQSALSLERLAWVAGIILVAAVGIVALVQVLGSRPPTPKEAPSPSSEVEGSDPDERTLNNPQERGPNLANDTFPDLNGSASLPALSPKPTPETPAAALSSSGRAPGAGETQFYVVLDYVDEAGLESVRAQVPGARVLDFTSGRRILLQQFVNEGEAFAAAKRFQAQGLEAEVWSSAPSS
ncbi:hypothetical protein [Lyngbya confervoides]|uniref:SPOR domain-containing protein n=1 Tax=Lyngbya confervoides BDU141951 TaxID=1574623 RepID=A0ABD4SXT8_9CYAN|nr:hypothetical protein [Lyngbya confervoides]MCM1981377.1 hypothetical protein [Lyngbya confervoides BDU141951]